MAFLQFGADINVQDNVGDTPLHKAAWAGRKVTHSIYHCLTHLVTWVLVTGFFLRVMVALLFFNFLALEGDRLVAAALWCLVQYNQWNSSYSQGYDWRWWNYYNAWGYEVMRFFFSQALSVSCPCFLKGSFLCSCREERDEAKGGKASGSCKRGRHLHSV